MRQEQFDNVIRAVGAAFPRERKTLANYFKWSPTTGRVLFKKQAPLFLIQAFHSYRQGETHRRSSERESIYRHLPVELTAQILKRHADYRFYQKIKKKPVEWALRFYHHVLHTQKTTGPKFTLTFDKFRLSCKREAHRTGGVDLALHDVAGDLLFARRYEKDLSDESAHEYFFLRDLHLLLSLYPIVIDPLIHDEFQDLLVHVRLDVPQLLSITRDPLDMTRLRAAPPSPGLLSMDLMKTPTMPISRWGRVVFLPLLTPHRVPEMGQEVQFRRASTNNWVRGVILEKETPFRFRVRRSQGGGGEVVDAQDIRFLAPVRRGAGEPQASNKMSILEFLYKFPPRYSRTEYDEILADYDD